MSEEKNFTSPFSNKTFLNFFRQYQEFPERVQGLLDVQMKNMQSINKVQQASMGNLQEIASRQNEIFSQIMQQTSYMANDMIDNSNSEDKLKRNTVNFKRSCEQALSNAQEIGELIKKSNLETNKILRERTTKSLEEVKAYARKKEA